MSVRGFEIAKAPELARDVIGREEVSVRPAFDRSTIACVLFLVFVFLLGGNSRTDTPTILLLRPYAAGMIAFVLLTRYRSLSAFKSLVIFACVILASVVFHLIPFPASVFATAPGREIFAQAEAVSGVNPAWRVLTLTPTKTANALFSLLVPVAALLVSICLGQSRRHLVWLVAAAILLLHCLAALAQAGAPGLVPYLHAQDEGALPVVGLMSNRNHFAVWCACMLPLFMGLTWYYSAGRWPLLARLGACLLLSAFLAAVILTTVSRAGIFAFLFAGLSTPWVVSGRFLPHDRRSKTLLPFVGTLLGGVTVAGAVLYFNQRMSGIDRLASQNKYDLRFDIWPQVISDVWSFLPLGSGWGSFVEVFEVNERATISVSYVNHAHNDWLEVALTGGALGICLLIWAVAIWIRGTWRLIGQRQRSNLGAMYARFGAFACALLGLASFVDYPLRTPMLASVFAVSLVALYDVRPLEQKRWPRTPV